MLYIAGDDLDQLESTRFERFHVAGDYVSLVDIESDVVEIRLARSGGGPSGLMAGSLWRLPGAEVSRTKKPGEGETSDRPRLGAFRYTERPDTWKVVATDKERALEISPSTPEFDMFWRRPGGRPTIKMRGFDVTTNTAVLNAIEGTVRDYLLELDLRYGIDLDLQSDSPMPRNPQRLRRTEEPPAFPKNSYSRVPRDLYRHGRAAVGLPLLQYQYYYQTVEFFFRTFVHEQAIARVRREVADPRFSATRDESISAIIDIASSASTGGMRERDQLRYTVEGCVLEGQLGVWLDELDERFDGHFSKKSQAIQGVGAIHRTGDIRQQVSDRIYTIRCRIVHAKEDGGPAPIAQLVPSSKESLHLLPDVELVKRIAEKALVARATAQD